jgi:hypothetical protein
MGKISQAPVKLLEGAETTEEGNAAARGDAAKGLPHHGHSVKPAGISFAQLAQRMMIRRISSGEFYHGIPGKDARFARQGN